MLQNQQFFKKQHLMMDYLENEPGDNMFLLVLRLLLYILLITQTQNIHAF